VPRGMWDTGGCVEHEKVSHDDQFGNAEEQGGVEHGFNRLSLLWCRSKGDLAAVKGMVWAWKDLSLQYFDWQPRLNTSVSNECQEADASKVGKIDGS